MKKGRTAILDTHRLRRALVAASTRARQSLYRETLVSPRLQDSLAPQWDPWLLRGSAGGNRWVSPRIPESPAFSNGLMDHQEKQFRIGWPVLVSGALWLALLALSSCQPMSREESDRILSNYDHFRNRTRGVPVRQVDK